MNKPTLFFSHSSKDKDMVLAIKNKISRLASFFSIKLSAYLRAELHFFQQPILLYIKAVKISIVYFEYSNVL